MIITPDDRVLSKLCCSFMLECIFIYFVAFAKANLELTFALNEYVYTLYANCFDGVTSANRISKKFKNTSVSALLK